jgi:hypothetical protein
MQVSEKKEKRKDLTAETLTGVPAPEVDNAATNHKVLTSAYGFCRCGSNRDRFYCTLSRFYDF